MRFTRKQVLAGAAAGAVGATGIYELVDRLATSSPKRPAVVVALPEQHLLDGVRIVQSNDVEVLVPPLHHQIITARLTTDRSGLAEAQKELTHTLDGLDADYVPSPAGLGVTVAWGLPYFRRLVPDATRRMLPHDRRAGRPVIFDAHRFPSDPPATRLESNDVAILLRSDTHAHIDDAEKRLRDTKLFDITSIRRGFAGGGFDGGQSLPKRLAVDAGVPGSELIPDTSELFLGFTSTQRAGMGPGKIANFETLGYVDFRGSDYFRNGTHMHLSHIQEDLETWYLNFDFDERVTTAFRPNLDVPQGTQTVAQGPKDVSDVADVRRDYRSSRRIGHSASIQTTSRLQHAVVGADGTVYPKGAAVPVRADFNTLDNPFAWSVRADETSAVPAAGVHFVVFNPTGDDFRRNRLAMDGVLPGGTIPFPPRDRNQGFNSVLQTTHRQNFLVPPRRNRSFPLARRVVQPKNVRATSYHSSGTVFSSAVASASATEITSSPRRAAIWPNAPSATRSDAFSPKRVARTRSRAVGLPPRWTWPSTVTRVSKPVRLSISSPSRSPTPRLASSLWPNWSTSPLSSAPGSSQPSLTTTIEKFLPLACRLRISPHTWSSSTGFSGIRITSAPPAMPLITAIQPVWRPITSTTMTRLWDSAVVWRRSIASVQMCTAVSKPNV